METKNDISKIKKNSAIPIKQILEKSTAVANRRADSADEIKLRQLEEGKYHIGDKVLYDTPPDTEWGCCCIKGDKDLCVFIFKCSVMSSVLAFCFVMLMNGNQDGFYISTLSMILGSVMGGTETAQKEKDNIKK